MYFTAGQPKLPPTNPQKPMGMWRSTQQPVLIPEKSTYKSLAYETRRYSDDIETFLDCIDQARAL
jgi:hypothetical protein